MQDPLKQGLKPLGGTNIVGSEQSRNVFFDALKGVAILLVVLGHANTYNIEGYSQTWLFKVIYSFHMPLFFVISGILAEGVQRDFRQVFQRKAQRLLIPFFAWGIVYYIIRYRDSSFLGYLADLVTNPGLGLWYLLILFLSYMLMFPLISANVTRSSARICTACLALQFVDINSLTILLLKWNFPYFALGYMLHVYREKLRSFSVALYPIALMFVLLVPYWQFEYIPGVFNGVVRHFTACAGIALTSLTVWFCLRGVYPHLARLGASSLGIYAIHPLILSTFLAPSMLWVVLAFVGATYGALLGTFLLRINRVTALIFLGEDKR